MPRLAEPGPAPMPPHRQRSQGRIALSVTRFGAATRVSRIGEGGPLRVRLPRAPGPALEAVLVNTGGGIACGDTATVEVEAAEGSELVFTTTAAEKIYRSDGPDATTAVRLSLEAGARLDWLPQETILFDRARLRRRFDIDLSATARLTVFEAIVFGRGASGERVDEGLLEDRWRIRRDGKPIFADTLRLDGPVSALLDRPAVAGGARALATFLYVAPDAEARLEAAREMLADTPCPCGASAWGGLLAVRFLAESIGTLRGAAATFITRFRGTPMPRVWQS